MKRPKFDLRRELDLFIDKYQIGLAYYSAQMALGPAEKWRANFFFTVRRVKKTKPPNFSPAATREAHRLVAARAKDLWSAAANLPEPDRDLMAAAEAVEKKHRRLVDSVPASKHTGQSSEARINKFYNRMIAPVAFDMLFEYGVRPEPKPYVELVQLILRAAGREPRAVDKACAEHVRRMRKNWGEEEMFDSTGKPEPGGYDTDKAHRAAIRRAMRDAKPMDPKRLEFLNSFLERGEREWLKSRVRRKRE
jgi:hypothetical protein